jgi:hypothetical protein
MTLPWPPTDEGARALVQGGKLFDRLADDACAGGAKGMADRRAAAVRVHALGASDAS